MLARAISDAIRGSPAKDEVTRTPYQFQSQLWMAAILTAGGISVTPIPTNNEVTPDYLLDIAGTAYALEVKRPESDAGINTCIRKARKQLASLGIRGGIALDISDCLPDADLYQYESDPTTPPYAAIESRFVQLYRDAGARVCDNRTKTHRPHYRHICFVLVYAKGWRWMKAGPRCPELFDCTEFGRFVTAKGNLAFWDVERLRVAFNAGLKRTRFVQTRATHTMS